MPEAQYRKCVNPLDTSHSLGRSRASLVFGWLLKEPPKGFGIAKMLPIGELDTSIDFRLEHPDGTSRSSRPFEAAESQSKVC